MEKKAKLLSDEEFAEHQKRLYELFQLYGHGKIDPGTGFYLICLGMVCSVGVKKDKMHKLKKLFKDEVDRAFRRYEEDCDGFIEAFKISEDCEQ